MFIEIVRMRHVHCRHA